jgi:hypothetical protein
VGRVYLKRNLNRPKENGDACTGETGRQGVGRENGAGDENEEGQRKTPRCPKDRGGGDGEMERKKRERW